jgi:signal transduction histidine kinase
METTLDAVLACRPSTDYDAPSFGPVVRRHVEADFSLPAPGGVETMLLPARPVHLLPLPSAPVLFAWCTAIGVLLSTQYLAQPFVWRNWPWDEVLLGWLEVIRDDVVVALLLGVALLAAQRAPAPSLRARSAWFGVAILGGALAGEAALVAADASGAHEDWVSVLGRALRWGVVASVVATLWYLWRRAAEASAAAQAADLRRVQLTRRATETRLALLRGQIEPHFLFNTLATVRRLHQVAPVQGARLLAHFVDYLRSAQPEREATTLAQEIELVRAYLGVVEVRLAGRLALRFDVDSELLALPFPPLTLATLVENAVKHGVAPAPEGGAITISVRRNGARGIEAVVADTGVGFGAAASGGSGIGLANIRARLQALYGEAAALSLQANAPSGVRATMRLPLARSAA